MLTKLILSIFEIRFNRKWKSVSVKITVVDMPFRFQVKHICLVPGGCC